MKGWRPSAWLKLETGSGLVKRANSCRTSDRSACLFRKVPRGPQVPFRVQRGSAADTSGGKGAHASASLKTAPALHLLHETGGPRNEDEKERHRGEQAAPTLRPVAAFKAESAHERKKAVGGRRNPLIRPDSAKEIQGFALALFGRALLDEARIWLDLGLAWRLRSDRSAALSIPRTGCSWESPWAAGGLPRRDCRSTR